MDEVIDPQKFAKEQFQKKTMECLDALMKFLSERKAKAKLDPDPELIDEELVVQAVASSAIMILTTMKFSEEESSFLQRMGVDLAEQLIAATERQAVQAKLS